VRARRLERLLPIARPFLSVSPLCFSRVTNAQLLAFSLTAANRL